MAAPAVFTPESVGNYTGAVGSLIAAVLETAGLFAQSEILKQFADLLRSFGVLLYVVSLCGAIISYALFGSYRGSLYLLIGPVLFFWAIRTTVQVPAASVQIGNRVDADSQQDQINMLRLVSRPGAYRNSPEVSFFFAKADSFVSSVVQQLVAVLINTENKQDVIQLARERVLGEVISASPQEKGFLGLLATSVMGPCAELSRRQMELGQARTREGELAKDTRTEAQAERGRVHGDISELTRKIGLLEGTRVELEQAVRDYLYRLSGQSPTHAQCTELWSFVRQAAEAEAKVVLDRAVDGNEVVSGVPWKTVRTEIVKTLEVEAPGRANEVLAAYLLRNSLSSVAKSGLYGLDKVTFDQGLFESIFNIYSSSEARAVHYSIMIFSSTIQYVQGFLLFLLAAGFPFFCLLLLVPSQARSILVWVSLWLWVKSWDVGFAFVHVIREFLWQFLAGSLTVGSDNLNWSDPSALYQLINHNNQFVAIASYQTLISLLTLSVPFITAHLCAGASDLFSAFRNSLTRTAQRYYATELWAQKRIPATQVEARWRRMEMEAGLDRAGKFAASGGGVTGHGVPRAWSGDGAFARAIEGEYRKGSFDAWMSRDVLNQKKLLSMLTPRMWSYGNQRAGDAIAPALNRHREQYEVRGAWQAYDLASPRASNPSTSLPKVGQGQAGSGQDGGGGE